MEQKNTPAKPDLGTVEKRTNKQKYNWALAYMDWTVDNPLPRVYDHKTQSVHFERFTQHVQLHGRGLVPTMPPTQYFFQDANGSRRPIGTVPWHNDALTTRLRASL